MANSFLGNEGLNSTLNAVKKYVDGKHSDLIQYVDGKVQNIPSGDFLPLTGGTLTGDLRFKWGIPGDDADEHLHISRSGNTVKFHSEYKGKLNFGSSLDIIAENNLNLRADHVTFTDDIDDVNVNAENFYYKGKEIATKEDLNSKQDRLTAGNGVSIDNNEISVNIDLSLLKVVQSLPDSNIDENKIYLVPNTSDSEENNEFLEYVYTNNKWELIGALKSDVNLDGIDFVKTLNTGEGIVGNKTTGDITLSLQEVNSTVGSFGQSSNTSGAIKVPYITVDKYGRITSIKESTFTPSPGSDLSNGGKITGELQIDGNIWLGSSHTDQSKYGNRIIFSDSRGGASGNGDYTYIAEEDGDDILTIYAREKIQLKTASSGSVTINGNAPLTSHQSIYSATFSEGQFSGTTFNPKSAAATIKVPTKTSHLTNDSDFITSSSTVSKANQLATSRNLWGQPFDGTADVSGNMTGVGNITMKPNPLGAWARSIKVSNGDLNLGEILGAYGSTETSLKYYYIGGEYNSASVVILPSGNVGIGTRDPSYKLHVAGTLYASGATTLSSDLLVNGTATFNKTLKNVHGIEFSQEQGVNIDHAGNIVLKGGSGTWNVMVSGSKRAITVNHETLCVGINNPGPLYTLDVNGTLGVSGNTKIIGDLVVSGTISAANIANTASFSSQLSSQQVRTLELNNVPLNAINSTNDYNYNIDNNSLVEAGKQYYNDINERVISEYVGFDSNTSECLILSKYKITFEGENIIEENTMFEGDYYIYTLKTMMVSEDYYIIAISVKSYHGDPIPLKAAFPKDIVSNPAIDDMMIENQDELLDNESENSTHPVIEREIIS